jgi:DNA repair protein RadA/Sms
LQERQAAARSGAEAAEALALTPSSPARPLDAVDVQSARAASTGVGEFDRVLGGGLVPGEVVLLAGEPGVGKSTLLLQVAHRWAWAGGVALYVTGEESPAQVRLRAERTGNVHERTHVAAESELSGLLGQVEAVRPSLLVVDSVQTVRAAAVEGAAGGVAQVRAVSSALAALAKERGLPVLLVGHVTKEGSVAGPRVLEHLVDAVLQFEGDPTSSMRLLRGVKNRFGPADEVGCFQMVADGIEGVADPSGLFRAQHAEPVSGTAITVLVEGKRPLLAEVQALVAGSALAQPRRAVSGLDSARVAMLLAVAERRTRISLAHLDVFTATVGGMRVREPAADLALLLAVASAGRDVPLPQGWVAMGEVGLAGEIRPVPDAGRRLAEAARLGFTDALVPAECPEPAGGIRVHRVPDVVAALRVAERSLRAVRSG